MPDIPPYATLEADRLLREGISPVLALEARIVAEENWLRRNQSALITSVRSISAVSGRLEAYRDALAIITAPQRRSEIDAAASQSKP